MRVIIAGGRDFDRFDLLWNRVNHILKNYDDITIVSGTAKGADLLGERYAMCKKYKIARYPANWDLYGKSAGYRRNTQMADNADMLIAFWDFNSRGTKHMIDIAKSKGMPVHVIKY